MRRAPFAVGVAGLLAALALAADDAAAAGSEKPVVVVGSKNFTESHLLAEVIACALEERADVRVERRLDLGGTLLCFEALERGSIDVYPEYTGTAALAILGIETPRDSLASYLQVGRDLARRFGLALLPPFGFENSYALAVRRRDAERLSVRTLSDLARVAPSLVLGASEEFVRRKDGLPGLAERYGLAFGSVRGMSHELAFRALADGRVDAIDVYTTDPEIARYDLALLVDDRGFFPRYDAAPLARRATLDRLPRVRAALEELAGTLDAQSVRALSARVLAGEESRDVARSFLARASGSTPLPASPHFAGGGVGDVARWTLEHLALASAALLAASALGVPAGILLARRERAAAWTLSALGLVQTVPSLALLGLLLPLLGIGVVPAFVALLVYGLLPIVRGTIVGLRSVDAAVLASAKGLGLTRGQLLRWVELPLALESIVGGVRTSAVLAIGTATLAAFIGAGGLGEPIFAGIKLARTSLLLEGAVPAAILAVLADLGLAALERRARPSSARSRQRPRRKMLSRPSGTWSVSSANAVE